MASNITQDQLDLCHLGMVIARMQLQAMIATATGLTMFDAVDGYKALEYQFDELSKQIHNGEIVGLK